MNKQIAVYDNTVSARTYLSYISEQAGGFASIGRDGKLYIKTIGEDQANLPIKYFQDFEWGEKFKISRVKYEDGIQLFEEGNELGSTVYISQDNMYIVDQEQINNIYDKLNNLEVYSFEGNSIIDPALDVGDLLFIDNKYVIYQSSNQYAGKFKASISSKIQCKAKQETTTRTTSQKTINRRVQSQIDQANGEILQLIKEMYDEDGIINENFTQVYQDINNVITNVQNSGGANLIKNSVMFAYDNNNIPEEWEATEEGILNINSSSEAFNSGSVSGHVFTLNNKTVKQRVYVKADNNDITENEKTYYTFSTKIKKSILGTAYVKISNANEEHIIELNEGQDSFYGDFEIKELLPKMNYYDIEFYGSEGSNATFTDNMFAIGKYKTQWAQASGEIMNTQVNININGVLVKSSVFEGDYTVMSPLEFAGYSRINGTKTKVFTINKDTTEVEKLKSKNGITMPPIKIVPVTNGNLQGWAFVPSN